MSIYAVDFDGTLCSNIYPKIGAPKDEVINKLIKLQSEGSILILWTCRTGKELEEASEWCEEKGLKFDYINENTEENVEKYEENSRKIIADYYLDDKSLTIEKFLEDEGVENNMPKKIFNFNMRNPKTDKVENRGSLEIKNSTESSADLYFYGDIVSDSWQSYWYDEDKAPQDIVDFLSEVEDVKELNIYINSGGGSVHAGLAIHNMLKRYKAKKTVTIDGIAASIASVIALAADELIIYKSSQFMIHKPWSGCWGNADDLREVAEKLDKCQKSITAIYMDNVIDGITEEEITKLINKETWFVGSEVAEYFNVIVQENNEVYACTSEFFNSYRNTPKSILNKKNKIDTETSLNDEAIFKIANKVAEIIDSRFEEQNNTLENDEAIKNTLKLEADKKAILEDLDLI